MPPAEQPVRSLAPLPLWAFPLLGVLTGLVSAAAAQWDGLTAFPARTAAALAFAWTAALGVAFLDHPARRVAVLGLAVLVAVLAGLLNAAGSVLLLPGLLAVSGAVLIAAWQPGQRGRAALNDAETPRFLVDTLLVFVVSAVLGGLFMLLLTLAAELLKAVGFPGVQRALEQPWEMFPATVGAAAFFVGALRSQSWGQSLTRTLANLLGFMLPVAMLIAVGFLPLLPVAGLKDTEKLFEGLLSSPLYLTLTGVTLLLIVMAFHQASAVLPARLQTLVRWGSVVLPVYPLLALYGLWKRVQEYGLTEARVVAFVLAGWLLVVALAVAVTRVRPAFEGLPRALTVSAGVLAVMSTVFCLPGLQPSSVALRSQLGRFDNAKATPRQRAEVLLYLQHRAGEAGKRALSNINTAGLDAGTQQMVKHARTLSYWNFHELYLSERQSLNWTFSFKTMQDSLPIPEAQQNVLLDWARRATAPDSPSTLCFITGTRHCQLRGFAQAIPGGQRILIPYTYSLSSGLWAEFNSSHQLQARGSFNLLPGDFEFRAGKNPFNQKAKPVKITLDALKLENGQTVIFREKTP